MSAKQDAVAASAVTCQWQHWAEFGGRTIIIFASAAEVHVNAMSTSVCHFAPV
jgi:hypothetical protein